MISANDLVDRNNSVVKTFAILDYLAGVQTPRELGVISKELGMNKSTLYRFLSSLVQLGYIKHDSFSGRYALGPKVVWLASQYLESLDIRTLARPFLERLVNMTAETLCRTKRAQKLYSQHDSKCQKVLPGIAARTGTGPRGG